MLYTRACLSRKVVCHESVLCAIEKIIEMDGIEFDKFSQNLLNDYDFIKENNNIKGHTPDGAARCFLIVGKDRQDGIIVNSEGYDYCRYSGLLPNVHSFLEAQMKHEQSPEEKTGSYHIRLKDLIQTPFEDVHLVHNEEDIDPVTIVELKSDTLTNAGKEEWADVLNAVVHRVFDGIYGLQIQLGGVEARRLSDFSHMLAGYCTVEDFEKWVTQEPDEPAQTMKL